MDNREDIVIIGCGGHAKSVCDSLRAMGMWNVAGFIDKEPNQEFQYCGCKCIGSDDDLGALYDSGIRNAAVGIGYMGEYAAGNSRLRDHVYRTLKKIGFGLPSVIDPTAVLAEAVFIDEGSFVGKNCTVNAGAAIGKMCIINTGAVVEHDCVVEDFSHISVCGTLCGSVRVAAHCFIGANATVIQGVGN